jgi:hypothetical protein
MLLVRRLHFWRALSALAGTPRKYLPSRAAATATEAAAI